MNLTKSNIILMIAIPLFLLFLFTLCTGESVFENFEIQFESTHTGTNPSDTNASDNPSNQSSNPDGNAPDVTDLVSEIIGKDVKLTWDLPTTGSIQVIKICRFEASCVDMDATCTELVPHLNGTEKTFTDRNALDNTAYCYGVFTKDDQGRFSLGTFLDVTLPDLTPPMVSFEPSFTTISGIDPIVVTFDEKVDKGTLTLSGSMGSVSGTTSWNAENTGVEIYPETTWTLGTGENLIVDIMDLSGNAAGQTEMIFTIEPILYVHPSGTPTNSGDWMHPKDNIPDAITEIGNLFTTGDIHIAQGTYTLSNPIVMVEGISLYGGYSDADWSMWDPITNITTVQSNSTSPGTIAEPNATISFSGPFASGSTIVNGLFIYGPDGAGVLYSTGILIQSTSASTTSPTIQNNPTIDGGEGSTTSVGIFMHAGNSSETVAPTIQKNDLIAGSHQGISINAANLAQTDPTITDNIIETYDATAGIGINILSTLTGQADGTINSNIIQSNQTTDGFQGILITANGGDSNVTIRANYIMLNEASTTATGVQMTTSSVAETLEVTLINNVIQTLTATTNYGINLNAALSAIITLSIWNNSINGGEGSLARAISLTDSGSSVSASLKNNILFVKHVSDFCIEDSTSSGTLDVTNNYLINCDDGTTWTGTDASNISDEPLALLGNAFDGNFSFIGTAGSFTFDEGGLTITTDHPGDDILGTTRDDPWSIGAYEIQP